MRLSSYLEQYKVKASVWLSDNGYSLSLSDIKTGIDAWTVAHKCGITKHAYDLSRDVKDAHIQTALESIFPNVSFKDKKVY